MSDLPDPVRAIIDGLNRGDRHPVEDAADVSVHNELDLELTHEYLGYEVVLRYTMYTSWHDANGPMEEFDWFEMEED